MTAKTDGSSLRALFVNSLLAFTMAFLASTLIHEAAHAVTARALGVPAVLHHNYVSTDDALATDVAELWIPASGPLASLLFGTACLVWVRTRSRPTVGTLAALWLSLHALVTFFGYLMLGPLVPYGDTGKVWDVLGAPSAVRWIGALAGLATAIVVVRSTSTDFERHAPPTSPGAKRSRGRIAGALIAYPILAGAAVTTLLSLPVPTFVSLLHPMTSPFMIFLAYGRFRRNPAPLPEGVLRAERISVPLLIVTLVLVAVSRALVLGLPLAAR